MISVVFSIRKALRDLAISSAIKEKLSFSLLPTLLVNNEKGGARLYLVSRMMMSVPYYIHIHIQEARCVWKVKCYRSHFVSSLFICKDKVPRMNSKHFVKNKREPDGPPCDKQLFTLTASFSKMQKALLSYPYQICPKHTTIKVVSQHSAS